MFIEMLKSKIHRATVTDANINYVGSITVDQDLLDKADIPVNQKVQVVNVTNGERVETYAIPGERGSGCICMNGAAAHLFSKGDIIIIMGYCFVDNNEAETHKPTIIFVDEFNKPQ